MGHLRVMNGPLAGQLIEVSDEVVIGRENVDLALDDADIARRHVAVRPRALDVEVEDLGSSNGTYVDGERISTPTKVSGGAQIRVGSTLLQFEPSADSAATRLREIPVAQATRVSPTSPAEGREEVAVSAPGATLTPEAAPAPAPAPAPQAAPAQAAPAPVAASVGTFAPPTRRRTRGLASRSWVPVVLSFGTVALTAIALVIYFAAR
jgi:pSer/pThr/pTyr-binding forkhead associated (FHA) protein